MEHNLPVRRKKRGKGLLVASPFLLPSLIGLLIFSLLPLSSPALSASRTGTAWIS